MADVCARWTSPQVGEELIHGRPWSFGNHLDLGAGQIIANVTRAPEQLRLLPDEPSKADALHPPVYIGAQPDRP